MTDDDMTTPRVVLAGRLEAALLEVDPLLPEYILASRERNEIALTAEHAVAQWRADEQWTVVAVRGFTLDDEHLWTIVQVLDELHDWPMLYGFDVRVESSAIVRNGADCFVEFSTPRSNAVTITLIDGETRFTNTGMMISQ